MIPTQKASELFERAKAASDHAYAPYSKFSVGAAVLTEDGSIYPGVNVENASYGLTLCAERIAICNAVTSGKGKILAIAVFAKMSDASPCGACRQFIAEFGQDIEVIYKREGTVVSARLCDLLPDSFSDKDLSP